MSKRKSQEVENYIAYLSKQFVGVRDNDLDAYVDDAVYVAKITEDMQLSDDGMFSITPTE